jgi:2-dehydro-3-deoxyphosphogluconate aldolase / (4S)-4-hydroxy-2-oxoglutarate aldolase
MSQPINSSMISPMTEPMALPMTLNAPIPGFMKLGPVLPVMVIEKLEHAVPLAQALMKGGIRTLEITLRTDCALAAISEITAACPDAVVGAGTVLTPADAEAAAKAGAKFAVSPGLTESLARQQALPLLPGVATASEVMQALEWGFDHLKFFPAVPAGGVGALKGLGGPLSGARFCPTGGIDRHNAEAFLSLANVLCVGGSWVAPLELIKAGKWDDITALAQDATTHLKKAA